ncbi:hypothetical protein C8R44DRAFT_883477 [Mycena epipterygia]|nr:hypothetical protein C8R44DRAFT_883474 [Mycena epipterygia]KAJ7111035.1 hypothetical protein C8R44DRAFT_883477 [Mycena epipterygia]
MALPDGVYSISSAKGNIVLDLDNGQSGNRTRIQAFQKIGFNNILCLDQLWLVQAIKGSSNVYSLRNLRGGTYMDMSLDKDSTGSANGNVVYGFQAGGDQGDPVPFENQRWELIPDGAYYKLRNVKGGTYLDLAGGGTQNGNQIQTFQHASPDNRLNQLWGFERRSKSVGEIRDVLGKNPHTHADFKSYPVDQIYFILDQAFHAEIQKANLGGFKWRREIFDCDDFAWVHKASVAKWGSENIKADGLCILCGFMAGQNATSGHAYNWTLDDDLRSILFFEPQNGQFSTDNGYQGTWGIF